MSLGRGEKAIEDARYVLPNSCSTQLIMTFNARSLYNFFEHRCCERAQWEIRAMADEMLAQAKNNILLQSAQAMLAQLNRNPQYVLKLLP